MKRGERWRYPPTPGGAQRTLSGGTAPASATRARLSCCGSLRGHEGAARPRRLMPDLGGLPAPDAAVGMVFLFFLLATACSMIKESVANVLGWRAKTLEDAI